MKKTKRRGDGKNMTTPKIGSLYHVIDDLSNRIVMAKITKIDGDYVELKGFDNTHTKYMRKKKDIYKTAKEAVNHLQ